MPNTVRFNNVNYDVEKLLVFKTQGTLVDAKDTEITETEQVATVDDPRLKHRLVVAVGGKFIVLVKPLKADKYSDSKVTIMTKLVLKKVSAPEYVEPRQQTFDERYPNQNSNSRSGFDRPQQRDYRQPNQRSDYRSDYQTK